MNVINLTGNLCNDVDLRYTVTNKCVVSANLAVKRPFSKDTTDFIPLVVWGQPAEYLSKYARKGSKIAVTGKLTTRKWEDKNGNNRIAYEVVCDTVEIMDSKQGSPMQQDIPTPVFAGDEVDDFLELSENDALPFD